MKKSELMWDIFTSTGYIGAYLFYKELKRVESGLESASYEVEQRADL